MFLIVIDVKYENMNHDNNIIIGLRTNTSYCISHKVGIIIRTTRTAAALNRNRK